MNTRPRFGCTPLLVIFLAACFLAGWFLIAPSVSTLWTPGAPPDHFGNCPAGQHWENPSGQPTGWECVR